MRRKLASYTLMLAITCVAPAAAQATDPETCAREGRAAGERGDERRAAALHRQAAVGFRAAGRHAEAARAGWEVVVATDPRRDSTRTWAELGRCADVALRLAREAKDLQLEALLLLQKSDALRPGHVAHGSWDRARELAEEALLVADRSANPGTQYNALLTLSELHMPVVDPVGGSWERAFSLHRRAAEVAAALGEVAARARHVVFMGTCALPGNHPKGTLALARQFFEAGELLHVQAKQVERAAAAALMLGCTFLPDVDPQADAAGFATARAAFVRAAQGMEAAKRPRYQARALMHLAACRSPGRDPAGSWSGAAALYERAAALLEAEGVTDEAARARGLGARCLDQARSAPAVPPRAPIAASAAR